MRIGPLRLIGDSGLGPGAGSSTALVAQIAPSSGVPRPEDVTMMDAPTEEAPQRAGSNAGEDSPLPADSDVEILGDLPTATQSRDAHNETWLRSWIGERGVAADMDLHLHPYKGWKIDPPQLQLLRAKNFLADEDTDRTINWPRKFAELAEYLSYLLHNYDGEDWGQDLREAIDMLHTHWVFENYHYGDRKLNLDFPNVWPEHSKRLPPGPGPEINMSIKDPTDAETMGERKLLYTPIGSAHDVQYEMPREILEEHYLKELRFHSQQYWSNRNTGRTFPNDPTYSDANMVQCENWRYDTCMKGGMDATADAIINDASFEFSPDAIVTQPDGTHETSIDSLMSFAAFRGARRAALELCLRAFDSRENRLALNPWRTLVLPAQRLPDKPDAGIIFQCKSVTEVPEKAARDPFAYTLAHKLYKETEQYWAEWARGHSTKEAYGHALWYRETGRGDAVAMGLPMNNTGPYLDDGMDVDMKKTYNSLKRCQILYQRLKRAAKWTPRELMDKVLEFVESGLNGDDWAFLPLTFRENEFTDNDTGRELLHLRPLEEEWLHFLGNESVNEQMLEATFPNDPLSQIFIKRLRGALADISPQSIFHDFGPVSLDLLQGLNPPGNAQNKFHIFTLDDTLKQARLCAEMGLIR